MVCVYVHLFFTVALYAVSATYFAGVMVRLMLTLTPCVCVLSSVAFNVTFDKYLKVEEDEEKKKDDNEDGEDSDEPDKNDKKKSLYDKVSFLFSLEGFILKFVGLCIEMET